ncbi:1-deoxy-D-xylulose-5-phosphate reductoisomerase [Metabacillus malikii]|uniref:1-deoxy-D-xylulose 5-phosphate reductoisomerase n=1 Tax=Metabacillus malikii TaxID=1504265 RepID=A0ABT9ZE08_9BACI|nr:1-deoxy-D-xylulose-5-phosphate reductoisomerase [Metabacillus malikii]MDQ0230500.1 1-deoxy-D-xylulose-5-phosphate reductoisomerase [Metabacillus malikii]
MKKISLLGATGSIGIQTLDVIASHPNEFNLVSMSFGSNVKSGIDIIKKFKPKFVAVKDKDTYSLLIDTFGSGDITFHYGQDGLIEAAVFDDVDILVNAVVGSVGLVPTLKAIEHGITIALANKETLVTAGHIVMELANQYNVPILPVDSEHSAIYQCLQGEDTKAIDKLIITASGGSFRDKTRDELKGVTVEQALNHPNWSMGAKITIDSATMMNKGLEVIEAHWLFQMPYEKIEVLLHKESIIHSMVQFEDYSVIAQLGTPDMRVPIQYALSYPNRLPIHNGNRLNLSEIGLLHFEQMDFDRFRSLYLAFESGKSGGTMPTVLNASNEVAVAAFLKGQISFLKIDEIIEKALDSHANITHPTLEQIQEVDKLTRTYVQSLIS